MKECAGTAAEPLWGVEAMVIAEPAPDRAGLCVPIRVDSCHPRVHRQEAHRHSGMSVHPNRRPAATPVGRPHSGENPAGLIRMRGIGPSPRWAGPGRAIRAGSPQSPTAPPRARAARQSPQPPRRTARRAARRRSPGREAAKWDGPIETQVRRPGPDRIPFRNSDIGRIHPLPETAGPSASPCGIANMRVGFHPPGWPSSAPLSPSVQYAGSG
jgi:hypothetical protein